MSYLKAYSDENKRHSDLFALKIEDSEVAGLLAKLSAEFKLPIINLSFNKRSGGGHYQSHGHKIALTPNKSTWLLVAHEFAHALCFSERRTKISKLQLVINRALHKSDLHELGNTENSKALYEAAQAQIRVLVLRRDRISRLKAHSADFDEAVDRVTAFIRAEGLAKDAKPYEGAKLMPEVTPKFDRIQIAMDRLPDTLFCPKCHEVKPKEEVGVRVMSRDIDGNPRDVRRQSYCRPCRSKKW